MSHIDNRLQQQPSPVSSPGSTTKLALFDQVLARVLARQADHALHLGFHRQAEHLAQRAEELRTGAVR